MKDKVILAAILLGLIGVIAISVDVVKVVAEVHSDPGPKHYNQGPQDPVDTQ